MSRCSGHYAFDQESIAIEYRDFVRNYRGEVVNVIEVNDDRDILCAELDEHGERDMFDVRTYEPFDVTFIRRWNDPVVFVGAGI